MTLYETMKKMHDTLSPEAFNSAVEAMKRKAAKHLIESDIAQIQQLQDEFANKETAERGSSEWDKYSEDSNDDEMEEAIQILESIYPEREEREYRPIKYTSKPEKSIDTSMTLKEYFGG